MTSPNVPPAANNTGPGQTSAAATGQQSVINGVTNGATVGALQSAGTGISQTLNINPLNPPQNLATFVYAPNVRVVVSNGLIEYDVSTDIVDCQLLRPENSAATFSMTLQNKDMRYTPPFGEEAIRPINRMDRIVVYFYKTSWIQVFAGYIDSCPLIQAYPGVVSVRATCTIKRLMHTWWDPALPSSMDLLDQYSGIQQEEAGDGQVDSGMAGMLRNILQTVGNWAPETIHIQNFPLNFYNFMITGTALMSTIDQMDTTNLDQLMLGSDTSPGPGSYAGYNPNAGTPGTYGVMAQGDVPGGELPYLAEIVAACDEKGLGPQPMSNDLAAGLSQAGAVGAASSDNLGQQGQQKAFQQIQNTAQDLQSQDRASDGAILGVAAAMVESGGGVTIRNLANPAVPQSEDFPNDGPALSGDGCGIFNMPNTAQWGNAAQRMNPKQAAGMFFAALIKVQGWRNMDDGQAIQMALATDPASATAFDAVISTATQIVQDYRTSDAAGLASNAAEAGVPGTSIPTDAVNVVTGGLGGAPAAVGGVVGGATSMPNPLAAGGVISPGAYSGPVPNSEGAINWARTQLGKPYQWGTAGPASYDCCLCPGSMVMGPGLAKPIEEVVAGDLVWSFVEGRLQSKRVVRSWKSITQPTYAIRTRNRRLHASANHPVLRWERLVAPCTLGTSPGDEYGFRWTRVDELSPGDYITTFQGCTDSVTEGDVSRGVSVGEVIPDDLAWLLGVIIGDGCLNRDSVRLCVFGDLRLDCQAVCERHWGTSGIHHPTAGLIINKASAVRWLRHHGFARPSHEKEVPPIVWSQPSHAQAAFLRGYGAADGHRPRLGRGYSVRYRCSSERLMKDVRSLHILLGDGVSNITRSERPDGLAIRGKVIKNARPTFGFDCTPGARADSSRTSKHPFKSMAALKALKNMDECFGLQRVLDIQCQGMQDTYDLEIEDSHNFVADGLVVHNSGLVSEAFKSIGIYVGRTTYQIAAQVPSVPAASVSRGDIVEPTSGHVVIWLGDGTIIEAQQSGVPVHQIPNPYPPPWYGVYRACQNGGPNPLAPFSPPFSMGPGNPPSALDQLGGMGGTTGTGGSSEGIARNLFGFIFTPNQFASQIAGLFTGQRAFMEGQPLLQIVQALCSASLRCWSSAPNGDFMAWYPDYFGVDGKPAVLLLAEVELKDVSINLSDDPLTTHVYINGDLMYGTDMDSSSQLANWLSTAGVVTVDNEPLFQLLTRMAPGSVGAVDPYLVEGQLVLQRYGPRPFKQVVPSIGDRTLEFTQACMVFMTKWAEQFKTDISMTFMPELFPGMRVELAGMGLQVYVTQVMHSCSFESGFTTTASIMAPSNPGGITLLNSVATQYQTSAQWMANAIQPGQTTNLSPVVSPGGPGSALAPGIATQ